LITITPGPKEPNAKQLQPFLQPLVNNLLQLWQEGLVVKMPKHPEGVHMGNTTILQIFTDL
ncbi:hypothetical protein DACRYDRAFT_53381, partial [Dacryopinax primogenitus]